VLSIAGRLADRGQRGSDSQVPGNARIELLPLGDLRLWPFPLAGVRGAENRLDHGHIVDAVGN
jgi:hypothetical protein